MKRLQDENAELTAMKTQLQNENAELGTLKARLEQSNADVRMSPISCCSRADLGVAGTDFLDFGIVRH